jgi:hypothetical protein
VDGQRGLVLLEEACRIADRLDRLDALLVGDTDVWFRLVHNDPHRGLRDSRSTRLWWRRGSRRTSCAS